MGPGAQGCASAPTLHITEDTEAGVQLVCTAQGWSPEPQVSCEDRRGEDLLTVSERHVPDQGGRLYVEDTLVLGNVSVETDAVSCSIHSPVLEEGKGAVLSLSGRCSASGSSDRQVSC